MRLICLAFLLGVILLHQHASLPSPNWAFLLIPLLLLLKFTKIRLIVVFSCGYLWALLFSSYFLSFELDAEHEGQDIQIVGFVDSLVSQETRRAQFEFDVLSATYQGKTIESPGRIKLTWYNEYPNLSLGEKWQLTVRLKRPRGFSNPGGFDYERWMFSEKIRAQGYVRPRGENILLDANTLKSRLYQVRQSIANSINEVSDELQHEAILSALSIGDRQAMSQDQWRILLATGTNHLMAISGLHIGLVAGLGFILGRWCWSRSARLIHILSSPKAGALLAIALALYYSFLAGFSVPTQRALVMVVVVMLGYIQLKQRLPSTILAAALFVVLLWDPLAVLSASFWLSFLAVGLLIYGMSGRVSDKGWWWKWGRAQWVLFLGLLPLLLFLFQKASFVAPIANIIAVPWVSLVVVPLALLASTVSLVNDVLAGWLFELVDRAFEIIWVFLAWLASFSWAQWVKPQIPLWLTTVTLLGILLLLAPKGFKLRYFGFIWLIPLFLYSADKPRQGELWFTMLDVGQGLSLVLRTSNHVLVYDTGAKFSEHFDAGRAVVVPYLNNYLGVNHLDKLIIGHSDNDHMGGASSVLSAVSVKEIIASDDEGLETYDIQVCTTGMSWSWDGVSFEMLHPDEGYLGSDNDRSCVLKVDTASASILITGDIEKRAESNLLVAQEEKLDSDILVVPHHGSLTSSTEEFIELVSPQVALFAVGYRNRYGFPKPEVVDRYSAHQTALYETSRHGAISFRLNGEIHQFRPKTFRDTNRYYWHGKE